MASAALFEWEGREYERDPKSADWYWALGIIASAAAIAALLFGNILLAFLIVVAAAAVAFHGAGESPLHRFALTERGLVIGNDLHPFEHMRSFSVFEYVDDTKAPPMLSVKTESWLSPHLVVPLEGVDADAVYAYLLERVNEAEHAHTLADLVAAWLGL